MKPLKSAADYAAIAVAPLLIFLMISSLANFLMLILYHGGFPQRVSWTLLMFTLGAVGIARVAIEQDRTYSMGYAAILGIAAFIAMSRFATSPIFSAFILLVIAYLADVIVRDCTLIDDDVDVSGQGLIDSGRMFVKNQIQSEDVRKDNDAAHATVASSKGRRVHQPGRTVMYLALGALPLFGIGQFFLRNTPDIWARAQALLAFYLFASLSLLVTTSFLGLRRYLRQRKVEMPKDVSFAWLGGGLAMIAMVLAIAFVAPMPGTALATFELPTFIDSPGTTVASRFGWGNEGADKSDPSASKTSQDPNANRKQSESGPNQKQPGNGTQQGAPPGQAADGHRQQGPAGKQSGGKAKKAGKQPGQNQGGQKDPSSKNSGNEKAQSKQQGQQEGGEKPQSSQAGEKQSNQSSSKEPKDPPSQSQEKAEQQQAGDKGKQSQDASENTRKGSSQTEQNQAQAKQDAEARQDSTQVSQANPPQNPKENPSDASSESENKPSPQSQSESQNDRSGQQPSQHDKSAQASESSDDQQESDKGDQETEASPAETNDSHNDQQSSDENLNSSVSDDKEENVATEDSESSAEEQTDGLPPEGASTDTDPTNSEPGMMESIAESLPGMTSILRLLIFIALAVIVGLFLWFNRHLFAAWWSQLWGQRERNSESIDELLENVNNAPPRAFNSFRNPVGQESDLRKIVVITFQAFEAWTREQGAPRDKDETPSEFIRRVCHGSPQIAAPAQQVVEAYNRIVYGRGNATPTDVSAAQQVWSLMQTS